MKPKDLKVPFSWEERKVFFDHDQKILYVPERCDRKNLQEEIFPSLDPFEKVCLEICSGNGEWICQKAMDHPDFFWVAIEKKFKRVQKIWSKAQNHGLDNLMIICGEAHEAMNHYLKDGIFDLIYINFPDPWPKKKHAKFRLMNAPFTKELSRLLKPHGELCFLTDDPDYSKESIDVLLQESTLASQIDEPYYHSDIQDYGTSYFRSLWEEKKRCFYFSKFQKKCKHS